MTIENVPQNEKFNLFIDYFVELWMGYENVAINTCNVNKHHQRANSAVEVEIPN